MTDQEWYTAVTGGSLEQGDLLPGCLIPDVSAIAPPSPGGPPPVVDFLRSDVVVLTQSCDLVNAKVEHVLVARVTAWAAMVRASEATNPAIKGREFRKRLVDGNIPGLALLNRHAGPPSLPWSVVDFHRLYVLPKPYLSATAAGLGPRLRLRPPYIEHLSQAFARYFMRVGLPYSLSDFVKDGGA